VVKPVQPRAIPRQRRFHTTQPLAARRCLVVLLFDRAELGDAPAQLLVLGGILMSVLGGWVMRREALLDATGLTEGLLFGALRLVLRYLAPVALTFVLLAGIH